MGGRDGLRREMFRFARRTGGKTASGVGRGAHAVDQRAFLLEADSGRLRQADAAILHANIVRETTERRKDLGIALVASELETRGNVQRQLVPAVGNHVAVRKAVFGKQRKGPQILDETV